MTFSSYPGTYVLTGSADRAIHLSRAIPNNSSTTGHETASPIQKYEAHGYSVLDVAVAADNACFTSVGGDRQVFLWDVEQGVTTRRWAGHNARVEAVQFAGEGDSVVVSGENPLGPFLSIDRDSDLSLRKRRHNHQPVGHPVQITQAYPDPHRGRRYRFLATRAHADVFYREWQLRWPRSHLRCPHGPDNR